MRLRITQYRKRSWGTEAVAFIINAYTPGVTGTARHHMGRNVKMLVIDLPSGMKVGLSFKHEMFTTIVQQDGKPVKVPAAKLMPALSSSPITGVCSAELYRLRGTEASLYAAGHAVCKEGDHYNKATGRKRALMHLLASRMAGVVADPPKLFTRDDRIAIWNAYWHSLEPTASPAGNTPSTPLTPIVAVKRPTQDISGVPILM